MKYARMDGQTALEVVNFDPSGRFVPAIATLFTPVADDCVSGATLVGNVWVAPLIAKPVVLTPEQQVAAALANRYVPQQVPMRSAQLVMFYAGLLDTFEAFIDNLPDPAQRRLAQIEWRASATVRRDNPLVAAAKGVFGMTDSQIDDLFIFAATIPSGQS